MSTRRTTAPGEGAGLSALAPGPSRLSRWLEKSARVALVCLDDDDPDRRLEVLWDLELSAQAIEPEKRGLGPGDRLHPPEHFGAYLHVLRWNVVSAADP